MGDGHRTVALLHGFLGSGRNLLALARQWSRADPTLRLILPDLPGHGREGFALGPAPTLRSLAAPIADLLRTEEARAVVGHSLGGRVGLAVLEQAPELVQRLSLLDIAPGPVAPGHDSERVLEILRAAPDAPESRDAVRRYFEASGLDRSLSDWLMMNLGGTPLRWQVDRSALSALRADMVTADLWPTALRHADRIGALRGGRSAYVRDADLSRLRDAGSFVHTVPGAGHFLHVEATDAVVAWLAEHHRAEPPADERTT